MDQAEFYEELDALIEQGADSYPEYNMNLEAFQWLRAIKAKQKRTNIFLTVTLVILLLVAGGVIFLLLQPDYLSKLGIQSNNKELVSMPDSTVYLEKIEHLHLKNKELLQEITELEGKLAQKDTVAKEQHKKIINHVVQKGETLYSLAVKYYGSGEMVSEIMSDNNIGSPSDLHEGMILKIYPDKKL